MGWSVLKAWLWAWRDVWRVHTWVWLWVPWLAVGGAVLGLSSLYWEPALDAVSAFLQQWALWGSLMLWLESVGFGALRTVMPVLLLLTLMTPLMVALAWMVVSVVCAPMWVSAVARRRFAHLECRGHETFWQGMVFGLSQFARAMVLWVLCLPLFWVPGVSLLMPWLIWTWLSQKTILHEVLAEHAHPDEMALIARRHRPALWGMAAISGLMSMLPGLFWWGSSVWVIVWAAVLLPLVLGTYMVVLAWTVLWFAHFGLDALQNLRAEQKGVQ